LTSGRIDAEQLRDLLVRFLPDADPLVFAVDVTTWPRCDAECSPERGYYYHPSRHSAGQPIIAGWAWQWIAQLSFDRDSWTAPVDARRLHPLDDTDHTAAGQIRALLARLPAGGRVPLFVFDGGYDSAQLTLDLAEQRVAVLVRLRSDRCFYADPPPRPPGATGRPRRHGAKFALADPVTWPTPTATLVCQDDQYGAVTVYAWSGLHPKQQRHPGHGSRGPRPIVRGTVIRVQVQRVPARTRPPKVLWLWWAGPGELDLDLAWRAYVRRFDLEHTVRFAKQALGWTSPRPRHPDQAERWTWLVVAGYTQLRLARQLACDQRLPWERPRPQPRLSPYRVRRGFPRLLCALGSPAAAPKPCGRSPGRPKGRCSGPARRYPAIKKPAKKPRKKQITAAKAA
jgi:Transposase DDE domain